MKTSGTQGKSQGWAAFALKQQQKQPFEPEIKQDPFPPIATKSTGSFPRRGNHNRNNEFSSRTFPLTQLSSVDFPTLPGARSSQKQIHTGVSCKTEDDKSLAEGSDAMALNKLKEVHSWADDALIRDIMGALGNDFNKASILLEGMVSTGIFEDGKEREEVPVPSEKHADPNVLAATQEHHQGESLNCCKDKYDFSGNYSWDKTTRAKLVLGCLKSLPLEPEWEEDEDIYARHRKDAIRAMRFGLWIFHLWCLYSTLHDVIGLMVLHPLPSISNHYSLKESLTSTDFFPLIFITFSFYNSYLLHNTANFLIGRHLRIQGQQGMPFWEVIIILQSNVPWRLVRGGWMLKGLMHRQQWRSYRSGMMKMICGNWIYMVFMRAKLLKHWENTFRK